MFIFGKLLGAIFGYLLGGPMGFIFGIVVGHMFDKGLETNISQANVPFAQKVFFATTFEMMGYIAKADGRVSEQEIQWARKIMAQLQLNEERRMQAINYFNLGKSSQFHWENTMDHFKKVCGHNANLIYMFIEIQVQGTFVEGVQNSYKRYLLEKICTKLGIPHTVLTKIEARYRAEQTFRDAYSGQRRYQQQGQRQQPPPRSEADELTIAYRLLGVTKEATNQEVKKAYRVLMSQHHPDKLVAKGLPPDLIKMATEKTQRIQQAYELVCESRGMG